MMIIESKATIGSQQESVSDIMRMFSVKCEM